MRPPGADRAVAPLEIEVELLEAVLQVVLPGVAGQGDLVFVRQHLFPLRLHYRGLDLDGMFLQAELDDVGVGDIEVSRVSVL